MKKLLPCLLIGAMTSASAFADNFYGALRLQSADQRLARADLTSPRIDSRISSPSRDADLSGAMSIGYAFTGGWRLEGEYTINKDSKFDSYWSPFDANVNRMEVSSERFMVNGFKDFAVTDDVSFYLMAGLGVARIRSEGYQTSADRRFANYTQNNFAYSMGLGMDYKFDKKITLGGGYRYVNMGNIETGHNTFINRINARDEQLKGKLFEQNLFLEARVAL
ncbi:outer membrane protein [Pseudomonas sp. SED1]|uniref:outer membrane protein n=1 Tax=Pseudomonas sp. SED1 TaxID=3056845 RepID=UPI00296FA3CE|nr:outer membrane beta-barrel protein [Pseudomonas sp. SED1]MDY0836536.1 outer membrane beta-barrel protein [Pseudomonas sp. SED1]